MRIVKVPKETPPHLNLKQFYHVAPESARQDIEKHGIDYTRGYPKWDENKTGEGNFLWSDIGNARIYRSSANLMSQSSDAPNWTDNSGQRYDIYEVTMPSVNRPKLEEDPEFFGGTAVRTTNPLPRRYIRRIE